MVTVKPELIVIGPALIPLAYSAPLFAVAPTVIFSAMVLALVLITLLSPIAGPPPDTEVQPGFPVPSSDLCISRYFKVCIKP